jgi:hypothetical protein
LNDVLYDVTSPISVGDAIVVNTNITAANKLSADIETLTNQVKDMNNVYGSKNFVEIEDFTLAKTNIRTKSINKSDIKGEIPNEDVILSFIVSNSTLTVNGASFDVYDINNTRIGRAQFKEDGQYSIRFNGTNFRNLYIFISTEDSDSATCTISNIMVRLASIEDDTYVPYSMTNQELTAEKADKSDLASISITGNTNNTGSTISKNTFFYKSGVLVRALLDIANMATLTQNTNYEVVTAGALNVLNASINNMTTLDFANEQALEVATTNKTFQSDGFFVFNNFYVSSHSGELPYFQFYINDKHVGTGNCLADNQRVLYPSIPVKKGMTYKYTLSGGTVGGHSGTFIPYIS